MNRKIALLSTLILVGVMASGYHYLQWSELAKERQAAEAIKQRQQALKEKEDKLVADARALLDEWPKGGDSLDKAAGILRQAIQINARSSKARIEMARFHIKNGYISYRNFKPKTLESAEWELTLALRFEPRSADAFVLLGHVYYLRDKSQESLKFLEQAEKWRTDSPWLYLNWADSLIDLHRLDDAESKLSKAEAQFAAKKNAPRGAISAMHQKRATIFKAQRKLDEADKAYQTLIAFDPGNAWARGNYASFLLLDRGMPDAAIAEAEKTIEIMNYGMVRLVLAAAHYAKWAEVKRQDPAQAASYLEQAKAISTDFSWIMPQAAKSVSSGPAIQGMVRELMAHGVALDTKDDHDDTGLTLAADLGNTESVELLIKFGANIESKDNYGRTALAIASGKGHAETVKLLTARGAKIDTLDRAKLTPLHVAILKKDEAMVRLLISLKADVNNSAGEFSPLMRAAGIGSDGLVRVLLEAGADPSRKAPTLKQTAGDIARRQGFQTLADLLDQATQQRAAKR